MKGLTLLWACIVCCSLTQVLGQSGSSGPTNGSHFVNGNDSVSVQKVLPAEWKSGAKWALFSTAGVAAGGLMMLAGEAGAYAGIFLGMGSLLVLPVFVGIGVHKAGKSFYTDGSFWKSFAGACAATAAVAAMEVAIFNNRGRSSMGNASGLLIFPGYLLGAFVIVPLTSALTYNLLSHPAGGPGSNALLNFRNGTFSLGIPAPVVYPNPFANGRICSQINLLSVTF
jgi:hypothetical protein